MERSWGRYPVGMLMICQSTDRATPMGRQSYRRKGKRRCHEKSLGQSDESNRIIPFWEQGSRQAYPMLIARDPDDVNRTLNPKSA
jgi:hypothetical protein